MRPEHFGQISDSCQFPSANNDANHAVTAKLQDLQGQDLPRFIWPLEPTDGKSSDPSVGSVGSGSAGGAVMGTHCSTGITGVDSGRGSKGFEAKIGNGNVSIAWGNATNATNARQNDK